MSLDFSRYGLTPYGKTPNPRQLEHMKMEKKAFIHFGVNTFTGKEWGLGDETEKLFAPTQLDTRQWARVAKEAGCRIVILTAKHHDGFCLWHTKYTEHNIKNSPYKKDLVKEFADACREYGLLVGIYISPWDRSVKEWATPAYDAFFNNQLTELLTGYGRIDEVWWDGAGSNEVRYDWDLWCRTVRTLQPTAAIFGGTKDTADLRWVGNEKGVAGTTHYGSLEIDDLTGYPADKLNRGQQNGNMYIYSETDVSIRPGWFYHEDQDVFVKTPAILDEIWFTSVGRNSNLLLNFPPDKRGLIHERDAEYARISHENIERMRSVNYADGATITADTVLSPAFSAENVISPDEDLVYASALDTTEAVFDIMLDSPKAVNVLALGEVIEFGERINSFTLESLDSDIPKTLCEGTSVGFYRAVKFDTGTYQHLRLTLRGAASIILRRMALHLYTAPDFDPPVKAYGINLVTPRGTTVSDGGTSAVLAFGGIYEFNSVRATLTAPSDYVLEIFDGTNYQLSTRGSTDGTALSISLPTPECGSYQIRLTTSAPFAADPEFAVSLEK